jgi:hypothetical protein
MGTVFNLPAGETEPVAYDVSVEGRLARLERLVLGPPPETESTEEAEGAEESTEESKEEGTEESKEGATEAEAKEGEAPAEGSPAVEDAPAPASDEESEEEVEPARRGRTSNTRKHK